MRALECVALSICPAVRTRGAPSSLITFTFLCPNDWNLVENLLLKNHVGLENCHFFTISCQMPANYFEKRSSKWTLSAYEKLINPLSSKKSWNFRIISCLPNEMTYLKVPKCGFQFLHGTKTRFTYLEIEIDIHR